MQIGLQRLLDDSRRFRGMRAGLICHQASVADGYRHAADVLRAAPDIDLHALFGPQHGIRGEKQDNMVESEPFRDERLGLPVHSLYGTVRQPTPDMLNGLDVVFFDLQDVGVRVYTFIWTMMLAMSACAKSGVRFVVLDRPNPISGLISEGPVLEPGFESFVGMHRIPLRHGLTVGELARAARELFDVDCELEVVPCSGWSRDLWFDQTGLPFVQPSPNLPTLDSCTVYPGMVLIEGTNLSEGRGTTRPFELIGAPFVDGHALASALRRLDLPGAEFRPCFFEPSFQKFAGEVCGGVQIHVLERTRFQPVQTAVALIATVKRLAPDDFSWREPPYEYEATRMPIDLLWGRSDFRAMIDAGADLDAIFASYEGESGAFADLVQPVLLY